jgi:hypothetical protein
VFAPGFSGKALQFALSSRQFFLPSGLVLQRFESLRGDRVLLLLRKSGHLAQRVFEQVSHKPSLAEGLSLRKFFPENEAQSERLPKESNRYA